MVKECIRYKQLPRPLILKPNQVAFCEYCTKLNVPMTIENYIKAENYVRKLEVY